MPDARAFQATVSLALATEHRYDVLVVGAGPAGSSATYHLAQRGADVLLVDRFAFPRVKRCGDGIITAALEELSLMGIAGEVLAHYFESRQVSLWLFGTGTISTCTATEHFSTNYVAPRLDFAARSGHHRPAYGSRGPHDALHRHARVLRGHGAAERRGRRAGILHVDRTWNLLLLGIPLDDRLANVG